MTCYTFLEQTMKKYFSYYPEEGLNYTTLPKKPKNPQKTRLIVSEARLARAGLIMLIKFAGEN